MSLNKFRSGQQRKLTCVQGPLPGTTRWAPERCLLGPGMGEPLAGRRGLAPGTGGGRRVAPLVAPELTVPLCPSCSTLTAYEEAVQEAEANAQDLLEES